MADSKAARPEPQTITRNGRRYFSPEHKRVVIEACSVPGASVAAVAMAHGFNANLVRKWIRADRHRAAKPAERAAMLPVRIGGATEVRCKRTSESSAAKPAAGWIEVEMGRSRVLVRGCVDQRALRVVLEFLRAR